MTTPYDSDDLSRALEAAAHAFLDALGSDKRRTTNLLPHQAPGELIAFDPLSDEAPLPLNAAGTGREKQMTSLTYLGGIARINAEYGRGANAAEVAELARRAGYPDGRAVSGWNSRAGSPRVIENKDGGRILNSSGHDYIKELASDLRIAIRGNIAPLTIDEDEQ